MTNARFPYISRMSALSAAVSEFLRSAEQTATASGNLYAAAYHLKEAGDTDAAAKLSAARELLERAVNTAAVPALRYGAELAELLERDAATSAKAEQLRWELADVWGNSDTAEPHPVPVSGVHVTPDGLMFLPHGDTWGSAATMTAEESGSGFLLRVSMNPKNIPAAYTMPPEVLEQLEQGAEALGVSLSVPASASWRPWRLPPLLILSARRNPEGGGVLLECASQDGVIHVPEGAGYALAFPLGGLFRLTVYTAELTGDPERPAEVLPFLSGAFLTHEAADALETLGVAVPSREPLAAVHMTARRKAWDTLPPPEQLPQNLN